jgi:broad specificity phosphatase PhoE
MDQQPMKIIYFTRHGLTEMNKAGLRSGSTETPLAAEGRAQAKLAGQHAKGLQIDTIACSTMGRAVETAEIIAHEIGHPLSDIYQSELLVERHFGVLEGQPNVQNDDTDDIEDIELTNDLLERMRKALEWIDTLPGNTILVVAHGGVGRALRHVMDPSISLTHSHFPNAEIVELKRA